MILFISSVNMYADVFKLSSSLDLSFDSSIPFNIFLHCLFSSIFISAFTFAYKAFILNSPGLFHVLLIFIFPSSNNISIAILSIFFISFVFIISSSSNAVFLIVFNLFFLRILFCLISLHGFSLSLTFFYMLCKNMYEIFFYNNLHIL